MRCGERLVQVDMHDVEAHVTWTAGTQHGVEVGTVVVHQTACFMHHLGNVGDVGLEESQRVGVGHHHGRHLLTVFLKYLLKVIHVYRAVVVGLHLDDVEAADGCRGRVGAVGRVRHDDLRTLQVTTLLVVAADNHETRQLTMGTGIGLQGEVGQSCQGAERTLEQRADGQCTACGVGRLQGVQALELR